MNVAHRLRERVTIQRAAAVQDAYGNEAEAWADVATVWAEVVPMTASRAERAGQAVEEHPHAVRLRHLAGVTDSLTTADRLVWGGRVLNVRSAVNLESRDEIWDLVCTEAEAV